VSQLPIPEALFVNGFTDLISVVPPGAALLPSSKLAPSQLGKAPGRRTANGMWAGYDWRGTKHTLEEVRRWTDQQANVGLRADHFPALDIDCLDEGLARVIEDAAHGFFGATAVRTGKAPKRLLIYRTAEPFGRMRLWIEKGETRHLVEVLGVGNQYLVHGIHPATKEPYRWDRDVREVMPRFLPEITREQVLAFFEHLEGYLDLLGAGIVTREGDGNVLARAAQSQDTLRAPSIEALAATVAAIPNTTALFPTREDYIKMGYAIRAAAGDELEEGFAIFAEWADRWEGGNPSETVQADWRRMKPPFAVGWAWLAELARSFGHDTAQYEFDTTAALEGRPDGADAEDAPPPLYSDQWLAQQVIEHQHRNLRFIPQMGKWLVWDSNRWRLDDELLAEDRVTRELRAIAGRILRRQGTGAAEQKEAVKIAKDICSAAKVGAVLGLVKRDRAIAVSVESLDHDPWVLCTPAGLVDLRTGELSAADPDQLCTQQTAVAPVQAPRPLWTAFLAEATGGDEELQLYLQRLCGYILTGTTLEQQLTFIWGDGGNGKSVFLNVLTAVLGDYARIAAMTTFTATRNDRNSSDIASLAGARLVTATETAAGKRWDDQRVKSITGGEPIVARFLYQNEFTFRPKLKLVFSGNYKPELEDVASAMRRRVQMVEFNRKPRVVDRELGDKLVIEYPAILAWMIEGCKAWQEIGLKPPASVLGATEEYFEDEDLLGRWLLEHTNREPDGCTETMALYGAWKRWAESVGAYAGSGKRFSAQMAQRGFHRGRHPKNSRSVVFGITLKGLEGLEALT
jgi:P4 family phage/plasmid primase-like protien